MTEHLRQASVWSFGRVASYPGAEAVVLGLFVAADVVVGVAAVPAEFVLLVARHVHILEVTVGLLAVAVAATSALGEGDRGQRGQTQQC